MGRYGTDQLNIALLILCMVITLTSRIAGVSWLFFVSYVPLLFAAFRMFSRNVTKRRAENMKFMKFWRPVRDWFVQRFVMLRQSRQYRFFRCPSCRATVRVPRKKGKIRISCPNCGHEFVKKT